MIDEEKALEDSLNRAMAQMLKGARTKAGLTQQQLSDRYDIPLRSLQAWEGVKRIPPPYVITLLLRCLALDFPEQAGRR